jgi:pimeloyl-ACP methyl ester carboxylesterase
MFKTVRAIIIALAVLAGIYFAWKYVRDEHYPIPIQPSESWEPFVNSLDAKRETFFVEAADGTLLEADLFIPNGGAAQKPALIFTGGSGDALYQNYANGLVETYVVDLFISRDFAVLLVNKRGMGQSEGNYTKNSIEGRADDIYAAVNFIQSHPNIDPENVGVIGHSQGGWVVAQAAGEHPDIAFFISLAGPTMTMRENALDNEYHYQRCLGTEGEAMDEALAKRNEKIDLSIKIGNLTDFGFFGFDARSMEYDPRTSLQKVQSPGLYILAEHDALVTPAKNIERMNEIFDGNVPEHLSMVTIAGGTHSYRVVSDPCEQVTDQPFAEELDDVLNNWLTEIGY